MRHERSSGEYVQTRNEGFYCGGEPTTRDSTSCAGYSPACNFALFLLIRYSYCLIPLPLWTWLIIISVSLIKFSRNISMIFSRLQSLEFSIYVYHASPHYVAENIP